MSRPQASTRLPPAQHSAGPAGAVVARQPGRVLGRRVELGQDARAVVEPGPGQRPEHRRRIPPADDPDVEAAGQHPAPAGPAFRLRGPGNGGRGLPRPGDDRVRQSDRVRRRHRDHPRLGHGISEFQIDRVRQGRQDLTVTADAAQQVPGRQAGHPGGHRRIGSWACVTRLGSSHVRNSTPGRPVATSGSEVKESDAWQGMQWDLYTMPNAHCCLR